MKKILSLMMVLALAVSCMFVFASCGGSAKPNADYEKAAEALEDAGYDVDVDDEDEACIVVEGTKGMTNHIEIYYFEDESDADDKFEELEEEVKDFEENKDEQIEAMEKALEEAEKMAEEMNMDLDEVYEMMGVDPDEFDIDELKKVEIVCGQDGTMVWIGTKDAIKAAK